MRGLHLDVMDGHFVPNMTYGVTIVEAVRKLTDLPLDVHLMIDDPRRWVAPFHAAGATSMTIHVEATTNPQAGANPRPGASAGIALNPPTPLTQIANCLDVCDIVLVMSVMPGFRGQKFDSVALDKLRQLHRWLATRCCWKSTAASTPPRLPMRRCRRSTLCGRLGHFRSGRLCRKRAKSCSACALLRRL